MARIVNIKKVKSPGACRIFKKNKKKYAFCEGAIGLLTPAQVKTLKIKGTPVSKKTKRIKKRWKAFAKIAKECSAVAAKYHSPKKGEVFRKCMSKQAKKARIKL